MDNENTVPDTVTPEPKKKKPRKRPLAKPIVPPVDKLQVLKDLCQTTRKSTPMGYTFNQRVITSIELALAYPKPQSNVAIENSYNMIVPKPNRGNNNRSLYTLYTEFQKYIK